MEERKDPVQEVEEFLLIFAVVCLTTWFIKLLCRPFQGVGFKGWFLGFLAVPLLLIGIIFEAGSFAYAEDVYGIDCVTVKVPVANLRGYPEIGDNIIRRAKKGDKFCGVASESWHPKWIELQDEVVEGLYIHKSIINIDWKKTGTTRDSTWDFIFFVCLGFYVLCAIACWQERGKRIKQFVLYNQE